MANQYLTGTITLLRRGGWKRTVIFWEDDKVTRKDTTGKKLYLEFYRGNESIATLSEDSGHIVHTPAQGQFNISITDDTVLGYEFQSCSFRMWLDNGTEYPQVIQVGNVRVL